MNVQQKVKLDGAFVSAVRNPILRTWEVIGPDVLEIEQVTGDKTTPAMAVETVLDAGRIDVYGEDWDASRLIDRAIADHGWVKVCRFLGKAIPLV